MLGNKAAPVKASGTPVKIIRASFKELSAINNRPIINRNVKGTTIDNRSDADCNF